MKQRLAAVLIALACALNLMAADPGVGGPTTKSILYGGTATLWPDFQDGTGVIDHGVGPVTSGTPYAVTPLVTTTYKLTITNPAGDTVTGDVDVTVATVSVTAVSPATKTLSTGKTFTFTSSVSGAVDSTVDWSVDGVPGGNSTVGVITALGAYAAPGAPGLHSITATSHANNSVSQSAAVTVVALPSIEGALTATPNAIAYGGNTALSATFSNGTGVLTGGATNQSVNSPVSFSTPTLVASTSYTLTVTNAANDTVTSTTSVTVSDVTMTILSPATKNLSLTKTLQPTGGVVSGATHSGVIWSVNGVDSGNSTLGTISETGLYTAPDTMPGSARITIRVRSVDNPAIYQELEVTLYKLPTIQSFTVN